MYRPPYRSIKGFSALLADLDNYREGELTASYRRRQAETESADMAASIREGGQRTITAVKALTEKMGDMSKRLEADARAMEINRRAAGREQLARLSAEIDESIAGGALNTIEVARLEGLLHRVARNLEHD